MTMLMTYSKWFRSGILGLAAGMAFTGSSHAWNPKTAPLMTDWSYLVDADHPLPEYPRPQLVRDEWLNLNGIWEFQAGSAGDSVPSNQALSDEILVPYPMESALSGVMEHHERAWYRRTFTVPEGWAGQRILLHLDAVDWESEVFVNGQSVGSHQGGYDPATYDITDYLSGSGAQELIVRVYDPTDAMGYPRGKQTLSPGGIMYVCSSGIWQPAWLEPVPVTHVESLHLVPDIDNDRLSITANVSGSTAGITVTAVARDGDHVIATASGQPGTPFELSIPDPNLWSPDHPFLYDLTVTLSGGGGEVESVASYFGMRKISLGVVDGYQKMLLNNEFVFEFGPLDQGFWPDGLYTAPTDDALKSDIEEIKTLGYNMVRKHIKVERSRWYYWADTLGILVWQDMPSVNSYTGNPQPIDTAQFKTELTAMVLNLWSHPSIISWVVFNESQGQHDTTTLVPYVQGLDPSRLVNEASGGSDYGTGDILDWHSYPNPSCPSSSTRAVVCGEFGGVGLTVTNHIWEPGWGYVTVEDGDALAAQYEGFCAQLAGYVLDGGLSAGVYTEITDVEIELNGTLTYDRKVRKVDADRIRTAIASIQADVTTVVPTSQSTGQSWKYTFDTPAANWYASGFNDAAWDAGYAGFGAGNPPNTAGLVRTDWNSSDIWMRRTFTMGTLTAQELNNLCFSIYHDEDVEIYINGVLAGSASGYIASYGFLTMNEAGKAALVPGGSNVIAVHCHQASGGQYIDVGLSIRDITVTPRAVPPVPGNLQAVAGAQGITLGWDSVSDATGYRIGRATVSGGPYTDLVLDAPLNAVTDSSAIAGETYYYVVTATNASGASAASSEIEMIGYVAPPPSLAAWFKADALEGLSDGDLVETWADSSGNGADAVQGTLDNRPSYTENMINGMPAVHFSGSNYLSFARPVEDDFTIICMYRSSQGVGTGSSFYQGAGLVSGEVPMVVNDFGLSLNANGTLLAGTGNPDVTIASTDSGFNDGDVHVVTFVREGSSGSLSLFVDGVAQGTASGGTQSLNAPDQLVIGAQGTLNNYLDGDIAEIRIYDSALSESERSDAELALDYKYGFLVLGAPDQLTAVADGKSVLLDWSVVSGATGYSVSRSLDLDGPFAELAGAVEGSEYVDAGAVYNQTNYYRVTAYNNETASPDFASVAAWLELPSLALEMNGMLSVNWPEWAAGWDLYAATNLNPPIIWSPVAEPVVFSNGLKSVHLPFDSKTMFFRLTAP
ncbi:MAG: hypothetical protein JXR25_15270 [Pontiellaceae bacterium]|nr:hypothetical protein [Pontiellaceae bacterium]MBN2786181.1 hypothetical protein [Pontiellaceae bacterium]